MAEATQRQRVVVVEDYVLIQEQIRRIVEKHCDCDVVATAEDAEGALSALREFAPNILILDLSIPGSSGFALAKTAIEQMPQIKILFLTAYGEKEYVQRAFDLGCRAYVLKESIAAELPVAIQEVTAGRRYLSHVLRPMVNFRFD